jgi:hypothetical protein
MPAEIRESFREVRVLRRVEEDPGTSVRRISAAESFGVPLVWRILHEQCLFIIEKTCGSFMMGHHLIFSPLSDST